MILFEGVRCQRNDQILTGLTNTPVISTVNVRHFSQLCTLIIKNPNGVYYYNDLFYPCRTPIERAYIELLLTLYSVTFLREEDLESTTPFPSVSLPKSIMGIGQVKNPLYMIIDYRYPKKYCPSHPHQWQEFPYCFYRPFYPHHSSAFWNRWLQFLFDYSMSTQSTQSIRLFNHCQFYYTYALKDQFHYTKAKKIFQKEVNIIQPQYGLICLGTNTYNRVEIPSHIITDFSPKRFRNQLRRIFNVVN